MKFLSARRFSIEDEDMDLGVFLTPISRKFETFEMNCPEYGSELSDNVQCQQETDLDNQREYSLHRLSSRPRNLFRKLKSFQYSRQTRMNSLDDSFENPTPLRRHIGDLEKQRIINVVSTMAENDNLIGDGSISHRLPNVSGKHKDLKSISSQTVKELINGDYRGVVDNYIIIDCRYPYEYEGGHIMGAENLYTAKMIDDRLLTNITCSENLVIIFHCEFSSERGPKLLRHLRNIDRQANAENYPKLYYPEIYLLDGGYKDFFQTEKELCMPQQYKTMLDKKHSAELRHFRTKSKSWHAGDRRRCIRF